MKGDLNDFILVTHRSPVMGGNCHSGTIWGVALTSDAYSDPMAHRLLGLSRWWLACHLAPSVDRLRGRYIGPGYRLGSRLLGEIFIKRYNPAL